MPYNQQNWFPIIYTSLVIVGSIILLLSFVITSSSIAYVSIVGYCLIIFSILLIIANMFTTIIKKTGSKLTTFLPIFLNNTGPFILNIAIIIFLLSLIIVYTDKINSGRLPGLYYSFSQLALFLVLIQIAIFYYGVNTDSYLYNTKLPVIYSSFSYLVGVINVYIAVIIQIVLRINSKK